MALFINSLPGTTFTCLTLWARLPHHRAGSALQPDPPQCDLQQATALRCLAFLTSQVGTCSVTPLGSGGPSAGAAPAENGAHVPGPAQGPTKAAASELRPGSGHVHTAAGSPTASRQRALWERAPRKAGRAPPPPSAPWTELPCALTRAYPCGGL